MEFKTYRVEVFITPQINIATETVNSVNINNDNSINELQTDITEKVIDHEIKDTEKVEEIPEQSIDKAFENTSTKTDENRLKDSINELLPDSSQFLENANKVLNNDFKSNKNIEIIDTTEIEKKSKVLEEHIYDEPYVGNLNLNKNSLKHKIQNLRYSQRYLPRPPRRTSSLKSIDESMEILEESFQDICYHGYKNGCTVAVQQPEEVSQEIFKENWLQKLEALRQREALLRDKEIALQSQERLLYKKEKQLRILERLIKDKMKQADLYLKRCKQLPGFENLMNIERSSESGFSHSSKSSKCSKSESGKETKNSDEMKNTDFHIYDEISTKNPVTSRSVVTISNEDSKPNALKTMQYVRSSKFSTHNSFRFKQKPKMSYDDLDSTLSADIGDSSFGVTATKFNPHMFKKPVAFHKAVSEKKSTFNVPLPIGDTTHNNVEHGFEEIKILKKFSDNIMVSQNKDTKFQNYGLIDSGINDDSNNKRPKSANDVDLVSHKKHSCTSLIKDEKGANIKTLKHTKERPTSWNAENDDWLRKKRQEYNMSMRRVSTMHNKENQEVETKPEKYDKKARKEKKEGKNRKFMIFR